MATSPELEVSQSTNEAQDYLFVLNSLRACLPKDEIVDWDPFKGGDVNIGADGDRMVKNVRSAIMITSSRGTIEIRALDSFSDQFPSFDPKAATIISEWAEDCPIVLRLPVA